MSSDVDEQRIITEEGAPNSRTKADKEEQRAVGEFSKTKSKHQLDMRVKVYSPYHDYYDGQAFSLTAENATGPFDILPKHHNFISLLSRCELIIRTVEANEQHIKISGGLIHVKADQVIVFLDV